MANYMTTDTELTAIANAIRTKINTSNNQPTFVDYIQKLSNYVSVNNPVGVIRVIYPTDAICTCTNGIITLTAPNTNGEVFFGVTIDTWTISCTNETYTATKNIIIDSNNQVKATSISFLPEIGKALNDYTWEEISRISQAGLGDIYFDIGECKKIILNGTIGGDLGLSNYNTYVFILDFNHPINKTISDNNIIFGGFKDALVGGIDIVLCGSKYGNFSFRENQKYFNMNHYGTNGGNYSTNFGGWKGCDFRYDILGATSTPPSIYGTAVKTTANIGYNATETTIANPNSNTLMAALPSDFRAVLRLWNRYIDSVGCAGNKDVNCSTPTIDAGISLLAEYEIFGIRQKANNYEQNHQKQMTYYKNGNSVLKYKHNAKSTAATWWVSSPYYASYRDFCTVRDDGISYYSSYLYGLAPTFKV